MAENPQPQKISFSSFLTSLKNNRMSLFRIWLFLAVIEITSLLLGFGVFLITIGLLFATRRIFIYWLPGRVWLANKFGLTFPTSDSQIQNKSILYQRLISIFQIGISLIYLLIGIYIINLGIDIMMRDGFLNQNFIYLIFFK
jgi:hypothetical protein